MRVIDKTRLIIAMFFFFLCFGLSSNSFAAGNSNASVYSSATVQFDNVINVPDDNNSNPPGSSSGGGHSGIGSSGNRPDNSYSKKPDIGSSSSGRLPQMGEFSLNIAIFILGIILIVLSIRYIHYRRLLHMD